MQILKSLISVLLLVGAVIVVGLNYDFSDLVDDAHKISIPVASVVFLSLLGNALAASLRFKIVARQIGYRVTFRHAMAAVSAGSLVGAVFFQIAGQLVGRSFVMGRKGVPFASVVVLTFYERVVAAIISGLLALAGAYFVFGNIYLDQNAGGGTLIKIIVGLIAAAVSGALLGYGRLAARSVAPWLTVNFVKAFLQLVVVTAIVQMPMMIAYVVASHALSPQTPIVGLVATSAIVMFAASVPVSLAGWGVREMSAVVALGVIGVAAQDAFLAAVIIGAGSLLAMALLAGISIPGSIREDSKLENPAAGAPVDYSRALVWTIPLGVATLVFFQIYVPIGSGTLLNVNLADPLAILGGVLFVLTHVHNREWPQWRYPHMTGALAAATLILTISLLIGAAHFGWTRWAVVNRYWGWFVLLAYVGTGALITRQFKREAFRLLLLTFVGAAVSIAGIELLLLLWNSLGFKSTLPLEPHAIQGFSLNRNFFAFQLLMALPAVFVAVEGRKLRIPFTALIFATLFFAGSRSGWITLAVVLAASVYMKASTMREITGAGICAAGIALLIIGAAGLTGVSFGPQFAIAASDNEMRMTSILGGLQLFFEHPILGAGLGAFRNELIIFPGHEPLLIHSTSIWLLAELGVVGLLAFAVPAVYALSAELRRRCSDRAGQLIALCLLALGVMSLPADMLYQRTFWLLFGAALMLKAGPKRAETVAIDRLDSIDNTAALPRVPATANDIAR